MKDLENPPEPPDWKAPTICWDQDARKPPTVIAIFLPQQTKQQVPACLSAVGQKTAQSSAAKPALWAVGRRACCSNYPYFSISA